MYLSEDEIKSIAESLDADLKVYLNIETKEIITIPDFDDFYLEDNEIDEDLIKIENNYENFLEFEKMDSRDSFRVMESFIDTIDNEELRKKLELGLSLSKPFRNFKDIIDYESKYREKWFEYKELKYIDYVKERLDWYNTDIE